MDFEGGGVAYGKDGTGAGLWVAVGAGGIIAKSTDGNVWSPAYTSVVGNVGGITDYGYGVAYGKDGTGAGLWVAVGEGGIIAKSTDGNIWTPAATISGVSGKGGITGGRGVAYGKDALGAGLWVAVGSGGIIAKSTDGNVWTPAGNVGGINSGRGVAYGTDGLGAGLWVVVGFGELMAKSSDGNVWTPAHLIGSRNKGGLEASVRCVAYGKNNLGSGLWVAGGGNGTANSSNGNVWSSEISNSVITGYGFGVAHGKDGTGAGLWVTVGNGGVIAKSLNGTNWTAVAGADTNKGGITTGWGVAYKNDIL